MKPDIPAKATRRSSLCLHVSLLENYHILRLLYPSSGLRMYLEKEAAVRPSSKVLPSMLLPRSRCICRAPPSNESSCSIPRHGSAWSSQNSTCAAPLAIGSPKIKGYSEYFVIRFPASRRLLGRMPLIWCHR